MIKLHLIKTFDIKLLTVSTAQIIDNIGQQIQWWSKICTYNPWKMSWNIQASLGENGSPLPVQCWDVQMCSAYLQRAATLNDGVGEGKALVEVPAFFWYPILNILIPFKNTRLIWLEMPRVFQGLFSRIVAIRLAST